MQRIIKPFSFVFGIFLLLYWYMEGGKSEEKKNLNSPSKLSKNFCFDMNERIDEDGCIQNVFQDF